MEDYNTVALLPTAHDMYNALCERYEKQGLHTQLVLVKKVMDIQYNSDTPLSKMAHELNTLHMQIFNMGPLEPDQVKSMFHINTLGNHYLNLQSHLMSLADNPTFSSQTILKCIH